MDAVALSLDKFVEVVTTVEPINYWRSPIASETDSRLFDVCIDLYKLGNNSFNYTDELLDERTAHVLAIFAERMASLGVTQQSQSCLLIGLYALGLAFTARDRRESFRLFPIFHDAALKCDVEPTQLFTKVKAKIATQSAEAFAEFLSDAPKDLQEYAFRFDPMGVRGLLYQRLGG